MPLLALNRENLNQPRCTRALTTRALATEAEAIGGRRPGVLFPPLARFHVFSSRTQATNPATIICTAARLCSTPEDTMPHRPTPFY